MPHLREFELAGVGALLHAGCIVLGHREHVVAAEHDADISGSIGFSAKPASAMRELRRGDGHPRLAAHHLEALLDRLLAIVLERPEVFDLARELAGLGGVLQGLPIGGSIEVADDAALPGSERSPQRGRAYCPAAKSVPAR